MTGRNLLGAAKDETPQGVNLLANAGRNLLTNVQPVEESSEGFLDTLGKVLPSNMMGGITSTASDFGTAVADAARTVPLALAKSILGAQLSGLEEVQAGNAASGIPDSPELARDIREKRTAIGEINSDFAQMTAPRPGFGNDVLRSTLQSVAVNTPGLAASVITRNPTFALANAGISTYGGKYAEASVPAQGDPAEYRKAHHAAMGNAYAEVLFELAPLKYLLQNVGKVGLSKFLTQYVLRENATEIPTTIAQNVVDWAELNPEKSLKDWALETGYDVAVTAVSTPMSAGAMGAGAHGIVKANEAVNTYRAARQERVLESDLRKVLGEMAGATGTEEESQILGRVMESISTLKIDPEIAELQRKQMSGEFANVPNTEYGSSLGKKLDVQQWSKVSQEDTGGVTGEVTDRREDYVQRGLTDTTPHAERLVMASSDPGLTGLRLGQLSELVEGSVIAVGGSALSQDSFLPGMTPEAVVQLVHTIAKEVGLVRPIILTMEQLGGQEFGRYQGLSSPSGNGFLHVINPRELPSFKHAGGNQTTQMEFVGGLTHEIGHALKRERWEQGITRKAAQMGKNLPDVVQRLRQLRDAVQSFSVTPEIVEWLREVAPVEADLLNTWNDLQTRAREGTISAKDLLTAWAGPRKFALGLGKTKGTQNIYDWIEREARNIGIRKPIDAMTTEEMMLAAAGEVDYFLAFDEFMAEQFSRAAYDRNYLQGTMLGEWFQDAVAKLKELFGIMQDKGFISPQKSYNEWLDEQTAISAKIKRGKKWGKNKLSPELKKAQKIQAAKLEQERAEMAAAGELELEEEYDLPEEEQVAAEESLTAASLLEQLESVEDYLEPKEVSAIRRLIMKGNLTEAQLLLDGLIDEDAQYDRTYTSQVLKELPTKELLQHATIKGIAGQQKLKKNDREALLGVLKAYPDGLIPRAAVIDAVLAKNVPLTLRVSTKYADYGLPNIGLLDDRWARDQGFGQINFTHQWDAPFTTSPLNHFDDPNYVAHTRVVRQGTRYAIVELQSDFFQGMSMKDLEAKRNLADQNLRYIKHELAKAKDALAMYNEQKAEVGDDRFDENIATMTKRIEGFKMRETEGQIRWEALNRRIEGAFTPEEKAVINSAGKQTWWQRILREEVAEAARLGHYRMEMAGADLIAQIEGWPKNELTGGFEYKEHAGIYARYKNEILPWLVSKYGAVEDDLGWFSWNVPENAQEILLWDKGNPASPTYPQISGVQFAGVEEIKLSTHEVQRAMDAWQTLGFKSPWFRNWWKDGQVKDSVTGEPLKVYHGSGSILTFFDVTLARWEKAFFFSATQDNAKWYVARAKGSVAAQKPGLKNHSDRRKAQTLRMRIDTLKQNLKDNKRPIDPRKAQASIDAMTKQLNALYETAPKKDVVPTIGEYYLNMQNPFVIDFEGDAWDRGAYDGIINQARELGHDGLIIHNVRDPKLDTVYIVFEAEQIKDAIHQVGTFAPTDLVMWDRGNPVESALRNVGQVLDKIGVSTAANLTLNITKRISDSLVQLQQRAAIPLPDGSLDIPMQHMLMGTWRAEAFKNSLQVQGEMLVREMWGRSPKELTQIYKVLDAEWKSGKLAFDLAGWDMNPALPGAQIIWGNLEDGGRDVTAATGKTVKYWDLIPKPEFKALLDAQGINVDTVQGKELAQLVMSLKLTMLEQFTELETVMRERILHKWNAAPMVAAMEIEQLYQSMQKIRLAPFFPQGWYGDWVVSIKERIANPRKGEQKYKLVRVEHYETKTAMQAALKKHQAEKARGADIQISWNKRKDLNGLPLQLPRNLLDQLAKTGEYSAEQLQMLQDFLIPAGNAKIEARYSKWGEKLEGGEQDIVRNFSNFIWHNANYIWKLKFKTDFTRASNAQTALWKRWQKDGTPLGMAMTDKLHRNKEIMERTEQYLLHPPPEAHGLRQGVALLYLAYHAKTALMNLSTMINTYSALTMEYGEVEGHKLFVNGGYNAARLFALRKAQRNGTLTSSESAIIWAYDRAVQEGVLDQSYAFFLAGQANSAQGLFAMKKGYGSKISHVGQEAGMFPFRMVEKANRTSTLLMFFEAERRRGAGLQEAYDAAVTRTNLLQNAFNAANRSELFRGKKALFTMFMSYVQFMTWNMTGGYAKAVKADLNARGMKVRHVGGAQVYTVKLILIYMLLGGLLAGPGFDDLFQVIRKVWRILYGTDALIELRQFIKDQGVEPDLIMHGLLSNVAGMDLSGSFSLGRIIPGVGLINRQFDNPAETMGMLATKMAGPFGGFVEDMLNVITKSWAWMQGNARGTEVLKEFPGELGALGKAWDAYTLQQLNPTGAVLSKSGARLVEDPPGSGTFRNLTNWEMIGMALGGNPAVLSRSRDMNFHEIGEQIYWRTKQSTLLDARWKAINTHDDERLKIVDAAIVEYNQSLPVGYERMAITGKMKSDSIKTHRMAVRKAETGRAAQKRMQPLMEHIKNAQ